MRLSQKDDQGTEGRPIIRMVPTFGCHSPEREQLPGGGNRRRSHGEAAQLVERWSEKPEVGGSIPLFPAN